MYFYHPEIDSEISIGEPAAHLFSCRVELGETVFLTDLQGTLAEVVISDVDKKNKQISYEILDKKEFSDDFNQKLLIQAITDKTYLEKLMEIIALAGVSEIILFESEFSLKQNVNLERLDRILVRSCEQSERVFKPEINVVKDQNLDDLITKYNPVVLDQNGIEKAKIDLSLLKMPVLVGPEGGWSEKEKQKFVENKLNLVSLGEVVFPAWLAGFSWFV